MRNKIRTYEIALREIGEKYKTVFENSVEGIILTDEHGKVTEWNKFMENKTGISKEDAIGKDLWDLQFRMMTEDVKTKYPVENLKQIWMDFINTPSGNNLAIRDGKYIGRDGELVLTEDIICPIILGGRKHLLVIQHDLTDRRRMELALKEEEQKLIRLNATKDKLFSIIAHDLRSPLNSISGFSELLRKSINEGNIKQSEIFLDTINISVKNIFNLLDNLLTWAKSQTGQIKFNPATIPLLPVIQETVDVLSSSALLKEISVHINTADNIMIYADKNMLKTILQNLTSNAIKYTRRGGNIRITSKFNQISTEIIISDDGTGIEETKLKNLFTLNASQSTEGTANEKGSGLGLVICKEFVDKHEGRISVESVPGKGSDFSVTFPFLNEQSETFIQPAYTTGNQRNDLKVLITDDEYHARTLLEMFMRDYCKEILFAKTGVAAVEECRRHPDLDLILMDSTMPEMGGYEATLEIRNFNKEVIIIGHSAYQSTDEKEKMIEGGCNDFLTKPIQSDLLKELINKYFKKSA
jgi:PAS domain S-box-containing protein